MRCISSNNASRPFRDSSVPALGVRFCLRLCCLNMSVARRLATPRFMATPLQACGAASNGSGTRLLSLHGLRRARLYRCTKVPVYLGTCSASSFRKADHNGNGAILPQNRPLSLTLITSPGMVRATAWSPSPHAPGLEDLFQHFPGAGGGASARPAIGRSVVRSSSLITATVPLCPPNLATRPVPAPGAWICGLVLALVGMAGLREALMLPANRGR